MTFSWSTHLLMCFSFNVLHKDWLTHSGGTARPDELCYHYCQMTLLRSLIFQLGSLIVTPTILLSWIDSLLLMLVFVPQWLSLHWGIPIMLLSLLPLTFHHSEWDALFCCIAFGYFHTDCDILSDHLRDASWEDIVKFSAYAAATSLDKIFEKNSSFHVK